MTVLPPKKYLVEGGNAYIERLIMNDIWDFRVYDAKGGARPKQGGRPDREACRWAGTQRTAGKSAWYTSSCW